MATLQLPFATPIFTLAMPTGTTINITSSDALKSISIYNPSSVSSTVKGTGIIGSLASGYISIAENESYNIVVVDPTSVIGDLEIACAEGGALNITAQK